ncbi:MAG: hypothetical protein V7776_23645, partial [Halopseudomonas aestusnigri]
VVGMTSERQEMIKAFCDGPLSIIDAARAIHGAEVKASGSEYNRVKQSIWRGSEGQNAYLMKCFDGGRYQLRDEVWDAAKKNP